MGASGAAAVSCTGYDSKNNQSKKPHGFMYFRKTLSSRRRCIAGIVILALPGDY
jgi:hypothetical protein